MQTYYIINPRRGAEISFTKFCAGGIRCPVEPNCLQHTCIWWCTSSWHMSWPPSWIGGQQALELIWHWVTHNCIRLVVRKFGEGVQLQLLQLKFWILVGIGILVMDWTFCLVFGYSFLVRYPWRKVHYPWLAIGLLLELFCLSRLRCSRVAFVPMVGWQYCYIVCGEPTWFTM